MNKQKKWMLLSVQQKIESLQTEIQVIQDCVISNEDKDGRDKLIWSLAKLNDLQRLIHSIK